MSVKHVREYYEKVCADYHEIIETLHELEEEAQKNIVPPERVENLQNIVKPMKDNYERWSYMMFLLNMPNKKEKKKKYEKQFKKVGEELAANNDWEAIHKENQNTKKELENSFN